jgi:beta-lactamase regulating signal transducer with metallopeptidase domain
MNSVRLGWTLIHFLWQGMLIAAIYAAIRRSLTGANGRYLLACAALFTMTAAPIVTWVAIGQSDTPPAAAIDQTARVSAKLVTLPAAVESGVPVAPATPWLQWAVMIWLAGVSVLSVRLLGGWMMAARLRWTATRPAPLEWVQTIERLGRQLRIPVTVGLRVSAIVPSPVVIGALRPLVLVPVGMLAGLPAAQFGEPAPERRRGNAVLPSRHLVDLRPHPPGTRALLR